MLSTFFFPSRLDPVLDGGVGHEDAVLTPQVPTGDLVGQAVFGDETDGPLLDPAGIVAVRQSQVRNVTGEAAATAETAMAGESDNQVNGVVGPSIPEVMKGPGSDSIAAGTMATTWAGSRRPVATTPLKARLGEVFDTGDALGGIGGVLSGPHGGLLQLAGLALIVARLAGETQGEPNFLATVSS